MYVALSATVQVSAAAPVVTALPLALSVAVVPPAATVNVYDVTVSVSVNPLMLGNQQRDGNRAPAMSTNDLDPTDSGHMRNTFTERARSSKKNPEKLADRGRVK